MEHLETDFDGVFRFSNNSDEEFVFLWNNREYRFPPRSRSPMIIPNETLENIQEIRKKAAFKWAEQEWFKSERYKELAKLENFTGGRNDKELEPLIQMCLEPLPSAKAEVTEVKKAPLKTKGTKAVSGNDNLNYAFADESREENIKKLGVQSDKF